MANAIKPADKPSSSEKEVRRLETDKKVIEAYRDKIQSRGSIPKVSIKHKPEAPNNMFVFNDTENDALNQIAVNTAFGTISNDFMNRTFLELIGAACKNNDSKYNERDVNGALAAMQGIGARDEVEAMLASQMVATHTAAMRLLSQVSAAETMRQQDSSGNLAIKLLRTFTVQMEALSRYRGNGQQKVTVEHVHVHSGGQAIVGNVSRPEGGNKEK